jgi:hypothetical protein
VFLLHWGTFSKYQHQYLDRLQPPDAARLQRFCLPTLADAKRTCAKGFWKEAREEQKARVKQIVEHVHGNFHLIRFAAGIRANQVKRMFEATQQAIARISCDKCPLPYSYSYEETLVDIDGRTYRQRVQMELWDFRTAYREALKLGYVAGLSRICAYRLGRAPFDKDWFIPRYHRATQLSGKPGKDPWLMEFLDSSVFRHCKDGTEARRQVHEFNARWGYRPIRDWSAVSGILSAHHRAM